MGRFRCLVIGSSLLLVLTFFVVQRTQISLSSYSSRHVRRNLQDVYRAHAPFDFLGSSGSAETGLTPTPYGLVREPREPGASSNQDREQQVDSGINPEMTATTTAAAEVEPPQVTTIVEPPQATAEFVAVPPAEPEQMALEQQQQQQKQQQEQIQQQQQQQQPVPAQQPESQFEQAQDQPQPDVPQSLHMLQQEQPQPDVPQSLHLLQQEQQVPAQVMFQSLESTEQQRRQQEVSEDQSLHAGNAYVVPPPQEGLYPSSEAEQEALQQPLETPEQQQHLQPATPLDNTITQRPIMHTFYSQFDQKKHKSGTGMTADADADLLQLWKETWAAAGFEPKVLSLEDAQRHPHFERYNLSLDGMPFGYYDRLCFLRWLAMAASGGGWMSDYDVLPLNPPDHATGNSHDLPNNGRLTVYSGLPAGKRGAVPCLVSGTAQEWDRMSRLLLENTVAHRQESFWSDMFAIVNIDETNPGVEYDIRWDVVAGHLILIGDKWSEEHCLLTDHKRAVHFSHDALDRGVLREGETYKDRPNIARSWLALWRSRCRLTTVEHR